MTSLTGAGRFAALAWRRDRLRITVWVAAITGVVLAIAAGVDAAYPTAGDLQAAAAAMRDNPSQIALNGPDQGLATRGGRIAFEIWNIAFIAGALMSLLTIGRHLGGEEASGRMELLRAGSVGRHAPLSAALAVVAGMNLFVGGGVAAGLVVLGLPVRGSLTMGAALAVAGLTFGGVAVLAAQVTAHSRVASALSGGVLALAFALRAVGDVSDGKASWLSPLGWAQASRPFADEQLWPLAVGVCFSAGVVLLATPLAARRDLGSGLVQPRLGRGNASRTLLHPLGLAVRLQRASLAGWVCGIFLGGVAFGTVAVGVEELIGGGEGMRDVFVPNGGDVTAAFFATAVLILTLVTTGFAVQSALQPRKEEDAGLAETTLATAVSRLQWTGSHLMVTALGSAGLLVLSGAGVGLGFGLASGDFTHVPSLITAGGGNAPAVWVMVALTMALFGLRAAAAGAAWGVVAAAVFVGMFGRLLDLPAWSANLSPFAHVPRLPAEEFSLAPLAALTVVAAGLAAVGLFALRRRSIG